MRRIIARVVNMVCGLLGSRDNEKTDIGPQQKGSYYFVPEWMRKIEDALVAQRLALRLTECTQNDRWYEFAYQPKRNWHCTELSREPEVVVINAEFGEVYRFLSGVFGDDGRQLLRQAEKYSKERNGREETRVAQCIVQVMVARAMELIGRENLVFTLHGDFGLIGRLPPQSNLEVIGNIETIEGSIGRSLIVQGNVRNFGCGPLWSANPVAGYIGRLEIHGDLRGYKSQVENPGLEIEVFGDVTTEWGAFYCTGHFRKLTVHGKIHNTSSAFAGVFQGDVYLLGDAPGLVDYLRNRWYNTSAGRYGKCNIFLKGQQLVKDGRLALM